MDNADEGSRSAASSSAAGSRAVFSSGAGSHSATSYSAIGVESSSATGSMSPPLSHNARSWVYTGFWATKRKLDEKHDEVTCLFPGCKKKFKVQRASTGNITMHLVNHHHVDKGQINDGKPKV